MSNSDPSISGRRSVKEFTRCILLSLLGPASDFLSVLHIMLEVEVCTSFFESQAILELQCNHWWVLSVFDGSHGNIHLCQMQLKNSEMICLHGNSMETLCSYQNHVTFPGEVSPFAPS